MTKPPSVDRATIARILRGARAKIDGAGKCHGGVLARDALGNACDSRDPKAVRWDLLGAINACAPSTEAGVDALVFFRAATGIEQPAAWFDRRETTVQDVSRALTKAIEKAEGTR